jgi:hypothetical protein
VENKSKATLDKRENISPETKWEGGDGEGGRADDWEQEANATLKEAIP